MTPAGQRPARRTGAPRPDARPRRAEARTDQRHEARPDAARAATGGRRRSAAVAGAATTTGPRAQGAGSPRVRAEAPPRAARPTGERARRTSDRARRAAHGTTATTATTITATAGTTARTQRRRGEVARPVRGGVERRTPRPPRPSGPVVGSPGRRQAFVLAVVAVLLLGFTARLVYVQALAGPGLAADAFDLRLATDTIPADRGEILDADGVVLATSVERWNIVVDQKALEDWKKNGESATEAAALLSPLLGIPATELGPQLIGDRRFVYLAKEVAPEVYEQVMDLGILGIFGERTSQRLYPNGTTGGNLLGFVGTDGYGMAGLEQVYEDVLAGTPGSDTYEEGARGQRIPTGAEEYVAAVPGRDVQLTIARDLQYAAQQILDAQVASTQAEWGVVVVTDVRTGEILVLADSGSIDPNDPQGNAAASRAVSFTYEPGSTAKVISMAAILETGVATPTSEYIVPYRYTTPNGQTFKDSHEHADLPLTLTGILAESSNTGTVMVGQNVPVQVRHDYLAKFGFGSLTGVGLPGETAGLLYPADTWDGRSQYAVLFGQAVGATSVQNAQVFATLANHGVRVQPHIVSAVEDADGVMQPVELAPPQQVISPETADTVVRMLESAVTEGTGGNAAVPGYRIAGKTGTAQAFEPGGVIKTVASFIGIAPADDPQIVVNVALYNPKTSVYGGTVAAPVFSQVTAHALQYLGVPPSGEPAQLFPTTHG